MNVANNRYCTTFRAQAKGLTLRYAQVFLPCEEAGVDLGLLHSLRTRSHDCEMLSNGLK